MTRRSARYGRLVRLCRARGCSREDARDVVQEAHMRLLQYQRSARVRDPDSLLRRIVINLSINHYHRERSSPLVPESLHTLDRGGSLIDPAPGPERTVAAEQQLARVADLLSAVSHKTCQILIAQRGGYSYEEIAAAFAVKPRTVEKHVASGVSALEELAPEGLDSLPE
jgi:RNA polymerase sigma factor (sigma-70 family)